MTFWRSLRSRSGPVLAIALPALLIVAFSGVNLVGAQDVASPLGLSPTEGPSPTPSPAGPRPAATASSAPAAGVKEYTLPPGKYQDAVNYARARYWLYFLNVLYVVAVLLALLSFGVAPRFRDLAEGITRRKYGQALIYSPLILLTLGVLALPIDVWRQRLAIKYNQSIQSWGSWSWDWVKGQIIGLIIGTTLIAVLYWAIRRSRRRWWFYFWLASIPILVFILFVAPVIIDPLYYDFTSLEEKQPALVDSIGKVVARGGLSIPRDRMFEMNASTKLKSVNAYVTGFGASKRVVVWDTTVARMTIPQTLFVFGHEMGHYVLGHIPKTIAFTSGLLLLFLYLGYRGSEVLLARWGGRWRIRDVADWASLPALLLLLTVLQFLGEPIGNAYSRAQEHESDVYGLEVVHGLVDDTRITGPEAFQVLGEVNLSDPDPPRFIKFWLYSHPPVSDRVAFARDYDPWSKGEPTRFVPVGR